MQESELTVAHWKKYGKDRLYVTRSDTTKVGWWDLTDNSAHPESPAELEELRAAVEGWLLTAGVKPTVNSVVSPLPQAPMQSEAPLQAEKPVMASPPTPGPAEPTQDWYDLAENVAGAEVRKQAKALQQAAPVRTFIASMFDMKTEERAWRIGADGEELVAAELWRLKKQDPRYRFLHSIPVGTRGSDIDHFIAGPAGFYTVNTKHHPGAKIRVYENSLYVNGSRQEYIRNSKHEAERASLFLTELCGFPVFVEALIVLVNADDIHIKHQPDGVTVVPRKRLAKWMQMQPELHEEKMIADVMEMARRSTTWTRPTPRKQKVTHQRRTAAAQLSDQPPSI